jgi:hypothetical protein
MVVAASNVLTWEEGKMFVFDDSFEHEVSTDLNNCFLSNSKWRQMCKRPRGLFTGLE